MARDIFISYRREDALGHAGRLFDRLAEHFGATRVFRDVDSLVAGQDFDAAIRKRIAQADALLVVIGSRWLRATDEDGNWRLADEDDWVRLEILIALDLNVRVIPVLVEGARMPNADALPSALVALARRNAIELRDASFDRDIELLIETLEPSAAQRWLRRLARPRVFVSAALLVTLAFAAALFPQLGETPEKARVALGTLSLNFDADSFVERAANGDREAVELFLRAGMQPTWSTLWVVRRLPSRSRRPTTESRLRDRRYL